MPMLASVDSELPENPSQAVTHLLRNNDIPLDSDIPFIRDMICHGQNSVAKLDAQIDALCRLREEAAECLRQHRAVLSPVRRIPPELICEIFALAWFSEDHTKKMAPRSSKLVPWHFGLICRSWRRTVLAYTPFWSSALTIPRFPSYGSSKSATDAMIETQLLRSGDAPLRVRVIHSNYAARFLHPSEPVLGRSNRWSTLLVDCDADAEKAPFHWLCFIAGCLAQLQKLEIVTADSNMAIPDVFLTAPALREVILTGRDFTSHSPPISIAWTQITHYRGFYAMARHMEILRAAAPALMECALGVEPGFEHHPELVTLPHLRRLCVGSSAVVDHLEAPLLETLISLHQQIPSQVLAFLRRSSCTLTKLVMLECDALEELVPLLRELPALNHLFIGARSSGESAQTALCHAMTSPEICPNLTSFLCGHDPTIPGMVASHFSDSFFAMVNYRIQPSRSCRLRYLRLVYTQASTPSSSDERDHIEAHVKPQLKTLRDTGLDAAFMYYHEFLALKGRGDFL
ncbi:hypothetical protein C8R47DRAFT_1270820 [Mycena vitilis]|nr:hypothetical protein C8R47DRAFT_1270820 [Mycena vitilis]